ncbi:MAG: acyltransferase [Haloferacaceae archaeon]
MLGTDPLDRLALPDGTTVEEHDLVTDGDVLVGGQSTVEFGVRGRNVVAGERVRFEGHIEAESDCRLDMWCDVADDVLVGQDAYLGERVHVGGQLVVAGDLDIGDDVDIEEGFEASGWIVIRNPMPTVVFLFVYLSHLLRLGEEEAAQGLVDQVTGEDGEEEREPLVVPRNAHVSDDAWRVSTPATVGDDCRLHGNVRATEITLGEDNNVFGSLRAQGDITVGAGTKIHGDVTTRRGDVTVAEGAVVLGDLSGGDVHLDPEAEVDGAIRARGEMRVGEGARRVEE